jgi:hypothetical protein
MREVDMNVMLVDEHAWNDPAKSLDERLCDGTM